MNQLHRSLRFLLLAALTVVALGSATAAEQPKPELLPAGLHMYVIERNMPGLGKLSAADLKSASQTSCRVLHDLEGKVTWLHSYCTGDKMFCVYLAPSEELVREHARRGGFPADAVLKVNTIISPTTAE